MEQHDCDEFRTLFEIHAERSQNCQRLCRTLSQQKHIVLQSAAPLQLKRFKVDSKMAIAASSPVLPNQKKQCCKIARFTDTPCISFNYLEAAVFYQSSFLCSYSCILKKTGCWKSHSTNLNSHSTHTQQQATFMSTQSFNKINFFVINQTHKNIVCIHKCTYNKYQMNAAL